MHLSDGQIQRLLHGELEGDARESATRHAAECESCAQALAQARREEENIFDLLHHVDHDAPVVDAARIARPARGRTPAWGRRAAGIVVVAALAGAAYAIPGSPLPALVKQVASLMTGERDTPPATVDESTPSSPVTSGIAVSAGGHFLVQFASPQDSGTVTVTLTDDTVVRVRVVGGTAAFTTDAGRLDIDNRGSSADYEIDVPRSAPWVEIRVASAARWQKDGDQVIGPAANDQGRYRVNLATGDTSGP